MTQTLAELNNNPLNCDLAFPSIRWKGADPAQRHPREIGERVTQNNRFIRFVGTDTLSAQACGWRCAAKTALYWYRHGKAGTIRALINTWCPSRDSVVGRQDNEPYILFVAKQANIQPEVDIDLTRYDHIQPILWAMHHFEAGKAWGARSELDAALLDIGIQSGVKKLPVPFQPAPAGYTVTEDGNIMRTNIAESRTLKEARRGKKAVISVGVAATVTTGVISPLAGLVKEFPPWLAYGFGAIFLAVLGTIAWRIIANIENIRLEDHAQGKL